jgi:hypothetical protein
MRPVTRRFWTSLILFVPIALVSIFLYLTSSNPTDHLIAFGAFLLLVGVVWVEEYRISRLEVRLSETERVNFMSRERQ